MSKVIVTRFNTQQHRIPHRYELRQRQQLPHMTLRRLCIFTLTLALMGYIGLQVKGLLAPPPLELNSPPQGLTTSNKAIEIAGKTIPGAIVEVNGEKLPSLTSGEFKQLVVLGGGINTITVSAKKRYSKPTVVSRQVFILVGEKISHK